MFALTIVLKLIIGLIGLFIVTRLVGKKALSEFTPFDFIYALVLGGILESGLFMGEIKIWHMLLALVVWGILIYLIETVVQMVNPIKTWVRGTPSVLIIDGKINLGEMKRTHIELEHLRGMLRQDSCFSLAAVDNLIMETDGQTSLMRSDTEDAFTYMLVDESDIIDYALETIGRDENWLIKELAERGYTDLKAVYYVEWSRKRGFHIIHYEDTIDEKIRVES